MKAYRLRWIAAVAAAVIVSFGSGISFAQEAGKPKVLFLTHSAGFKHSSLATAERTVIEMGRKSGAFEAVTLKGYQQEGGKIDLSMISANPGVNPSLIITTLTGRAMSEIPSK